jgi:hypothetical protein
LFSSSFWEQGFDKVRESSRTLELFEWFDVQFWDPWASPTASNISQFVKYVKRLIIIKEKDPEWEYATIQPKGLGCSAQVYCAH